MKYPKEEFEQMIEFVINGNHTLSNRNNSLVDRTIMCTYYFNEEKGLQEQLKIKI